MRRSTFVLSTLFALASFAALADPAPTAAVAVRGTKAQAVAMVRLVQKMFAKEGAKKTFAAITDPSTPQFHQGDLYPFVFTLSGTCVAHGARPALVGKDLIGLKDPDGKFLIRDMAALAPKGEGWYNYKWPTPHSNLIEDKSSFYSMLGSKYFVGVGVYRDGN
ncbi:MAG TPA: cache domain-containing protein [Beijerinckiaceae bacterium]|nr:cache domain-containing protein [Beijerinckiaceae bacterium]